MPLKTLIDYQLLCLKNNKPKDFKKFLRVSTSLIGLNSRYDELITMYNSQNRKLINLEHKNRALELEASKLKAEIESSDRVILELENQNINLKNNLAL